MELTITRSEAAELEAALWARIGKLEYSLWDSELMLQGKAQEEVEERLDLMRTTLRNLIHLKGE